MNAPRGALLSFEGTEGSGKSTQMRLLVDRLRANGFVVTENQEPGATRIGKQIRRILLDPVHSEMAPMAELLLMFASRAQAAAEIIRPALERGDVVVSDRFTDSTLAYQGFARELGFETVRAIHSLAVGSLLPDLTIALDMDVETGLARAHHRNRTDIASEVETRLDRQSLTFHRRVAQGYRHIAALEPDRFKFIAANGAPDEICERVWAVVHPFLLTRV